MFLLVMLMVVSSIVQVVRVVHVDNDHAFAAVIIVASGDGATVC